jgi:hypothetical protein
VGARVALGHAEESLVELRVDGFHERLDGVLAIADVRRLVRVGKSEAAGIVIDDPDPVYRTPRL